ncbi:disease resistance protein RUN1 [Quercus suber]|uniref:disease resistance protein RUN1 n=1 Tax=Quercus suber TaxID=58331 RepID=UPI0032DE7355
MVGIHGIGGVGKTTIAKAVYNNMADHYDVSIFLENVREKSSTKEGIIQLQKGLLSKVLGDGFHLGSVPEGTKKIEDALCSKKVLLVLDDVDKGKEIENLLGGCDWFATGSRIIITTRDKQVLNTLENPHYFKVEEMDQHEALELFSKHAFHKNEPNAAYLQLAKQIISYANGLPLALEIIGSGLRGKSIFEWQSELDKYERIINKGIQDVLKVSYEGLDKIEQDVFLDIACFFKGFDKDYVVNMLEACGQFPNSVIPKLIDRCLITVDQFGKLSMHDLVQDMGRGIVQEESPYNAGQRSRLWYHTDALEVLIGNTGTVNIRGLMLCSPEPTTVQLEAKVFKEMKNLKFLIVRNVKILRGLEYIPSGLRLLDWPDYTFPLPATFCPQLLVELNMPYNHIKLEEPFKQEIQFKNMEYIRCESCETIMKFPAMCTPNLKELNLSECKELVEVHESVGFLDKLELLILKGCEQLQTLPRSLMLRSLRYFDLRDCSRLEKFPNIQPGMGSLQILLLSRTGIKGLPSSIGNLIGLEKLDLSYCQNLMDLPDSIYKLQNLRVFEICGCTRLKIDRRLMCNSFGSLPGYGFLKLKYLNLSNCENLTELDFLMMPDYFPELKYLYLDGTNIGMIPESISKFARLRRIGIENCMQLQEIPRLPQAIRIVCAMNCPLLNSRSLSSLLSQAGEILGILPKRICQGARSNILIDPQSSNRLSHQFVPSPLVFEDFASETEGSRSEDEDIDCEIILPGVDIPKWFKYRSVGHSISFWVGPKFPELAICIAFGPEAHRGGFVCQVYLSINGCKKRINVLNCKKEVCDHLWLFSKSHRELQKQMDDSNPSNWNHAEVVCNLYFPDGGESVPAFIKGCWVHVDCACHPQNSDFFNDNYENVIDNSRQESRCMMLNIVNVTENMAPSELEMQHKCHSTNTGSDLGLGWPVSEFGSTDSSGFDLGLSSMTYTFLKDDSDFNVLKKMRKSC